MHNGLLTDRSWAVKRLANEEARLLNHPLIGTEHLLIALVKIESCIAANVLKNRDIDCQIVRREIDELVKSGIEPIRATKLPLTLEAKKVIEYSLSEAHRLNRLPVNTGHILLGMLHEKNGVAGEVLRNLGLVLEDLRHDVVAAGANASSEYDESYPSYLASSARSTVIKILQRFWKR